MFKIILSLSFLLGLTQSLESAIVTKKELAQIEAEFQKKIKSKDLDDKKIFYANLLAARELYVYRFFDKSEHYYEEAKKVKISEDMSEAYINLMAIALVENNKIKLQKRFEEATRYFSNEKKYKKVEIDYYLTSIESYLNGKSSRPVKGYYGKFVQEENLIERIKKKDYEGSLSSLNPESLLE